MKNYQKGKQFQPFEALKGFKEEIKKQELEITDKPTLSVDQEEDINSLLLQLNINDLIYLLYYNQNHFIEIKGKVNKINAQYHYLIVNNLKIYFEQIIQMNIING